MLFTEFSIVLVQDAASTHQRVFAKLYLADRFLYRLDGCCQCICAKHALENVDVSRNECDAAA